jgi:membrane protease YdiL (CAAX protease family)
MSAMRRIQILIGLIPTLIITFAPLGRWGKNHLGLGPLWGNELPFWALTAVLLLYVVLVERKSLSSIGLKLPGLVDCLLAVGTAMVLVGAMVFSYAVLFPSLHLKANTGQMNALLHTPFWYRFWLVTRAAVSEEILFRGYPIERIREWSGSRWLAALFSVAAFTYAHLAGWGPAQLIPVAWAGIVLALLYLWRRNLGTNILAHWLTDGAGFLLPQ